MITYIAASLVVSCLVFYLTKTYKIIIRHSTLKDVVWFFVASLCKAVLMAVVFALTVSGWTLNAVFAGLVEFLLTLCLLLLLRVAMIVVYDYAKSAVKLRYDCENVLVYGISDKSVALITRLQLSPHYKVRGFIVPKSPDSTPALIGHLKINYYASEEDFVELIGRIGFDAIIFATAHDAREAHETLIKYAIGNKIKTLIAPGIDEIKNGNIAAASVRKVDIEDLLGREEIKISMDEVIGNFVGKVVMVTGAAGSIGSELVRQLATFGVKQLVLYDYAETPLHELRLELEDKFPELDFVPIVGDVRLPNRLDYAFRKFRPQVVFHAAAYKHVPLMEENPCEAVHSNVFGSRNVADKCIEYDVEKMVMISTDKAVNPTNIMGCTKRLAEIYCQSLGLAVEKGLVKGKTKFVTTRFGNVLGSNGSVIPRFREQIANGGPVTVTHPDIVRFFMTIPEACRLVMEAATMSTGTQIFVFDMGEAVKIDHLARRMIELSGLVPDVDIKIEYTGLRPGEKLYEEVLSNTEDTLPTSHNRIRIAKVRKYDYADAAAAADELDKLAVAVNIPDMVRLMKRTVPEFKSRNSRFEVYDREMEEALSSRPGEVGGERSNVALEQ